MGRPAKVVVLIQARMGSDRLPGKVAEYIGDKTMLTRVRERAEQLGYPVHVCWPTPLDPEEDVLRRLLRVARNLRARHVVRVTADCPFLDVEAGRWTIQHHLDTGADFTQHIAEGRGVEVFRTRVLGLIDRKAPPGPNRFREHIDLWVLEHPQDFHIETMKFSVDTAAELELARRRFEMGKVMSKSAAAKKARSGADMGAKGKNFNKIAAKAAAKYGSKAAGDRVAGAVFQAKRRKGTL